VTGTFAARDAAAGAFVRFLDSSSFTVGTVAGDACAAGAAGVRTTNGDASLTSGGSLTIVQPIIAGTATIRLKSQGDLTQSGAGTITGNALGVQAGGVVTLGLGNSVSIFTAQAGG